MKIDLKELFDKSNGINEKLHQTLLKALAKAHIKDFDYLKFRQSVINMKNMGMDEETSIKSAFVTAGTMGLTKDKLLKTAYHYQTALNKEKEKFALALKNKIAKDIDGRRVGAKKYAQEIENHKKTIEKLKLEIELYQKEINKVEENVAIAKEKIEATRDSFKTTFDELYGQLESDVRNIETLL